MGAPKGNQYAKGKATGRPSSYKPEYAEQAYKLCLLLNATDKELAEFFEVQESTINEWKLKHDEFSESIKKGKEIADANVGNRLYERATGYDYEEDHVSNYKGDINVTRIQKHALPDTTAQIFWLKNRQPGKWRDKINHELSGENGGPVRVEVVLPDNERTKTEQE